MPTIKLNVGASPLWEKEGWHTLDHKFRASSATSLAGDAASIPLPDESCETIFCSHMFEHIPHTRLEDILLEFNRALGKQAILRVLLPDLRKVATAYVNNDHEFFKAARQEDESLRTDLGLGGMFMNFIVSPGQDTALMNRGLDRFIAGYAHLYAYDFDMLRILFERTGFSAVKQMEFCHSEQPEYTEPLHVFGKESVWHGFNKAYYEKHGLIHRYNPETGGYDINFRVTGFDRDPLTSLIIEARKAVNIDRATYQSLNQSPDNYNRYAFSLLGDAQFTKRLDQITKVVVD